jgi:hypothetical protein
MEQSVPELVSKARLVAAGCWDIFGHKTLSSFMSQFFLKLRSGEQLSPDDGCLSLCMIAAQVFPFPLSLQTFRFLSLSFLCIPLFTSYLSSPLSSHLTTLVTSLTHSLALSSLPCVTHSTQTKDDTEMLWRRWRWRSNDFLCFPTLKETHGINS